jgi:hypothetical protein
MNFAAIGGAARANRDIEAVGRFILAGFHRAQDSIRKGIGDGFIV